jgi:hypothetical protein
MSRKGEVWGDGGEGDARLQSDPLDKECPVDHQKSREDETVSCR